MPADASPDGSSPTNQDNRGNVAVTPQSADETADASTNSDNRYLFLQRHVPVLVTVLAAGMLIYVTYLFTHPNPALGGGLFLAMAEAVLENGYHYPVHLPNYTPGGIPFVYPPLAFYGLAALLDLGLAPLTIARVLPGLVTVAAIVPTYLVGIRILGSRAKAGFAALVVAVEPAIFTWHLSAGGVVRAPAFFLTICGLYVGYCLFETSGSSADLKSDPSITADFSPWCWVILSTILFGLTVVTHPLYPVLFGSSLLYFYLALDRSRRGLLRGVIVAFGGLMLAAPWWFTVASRHGLEVLTRAGGSRIGLGQGFIWLPTNFAYLPDTRFLALWHVLTLLGLLTLLARRRYVLPGWFAMVALIYPEPRFLLFVGAFLASVFVFDGIVPLATATNDPQHSEQRRWSTPKVLGGNTADSHRVALTIVVVLACYGGATGALYAASYEPISDRPLDRLVAEPLPAYADEKDLAAMRWVRAHTRPNATVLIAGDTAEWFPLIAERTSVASPWGAEWLPPEERNRQIELYRASAECNSATCLMRVLERPTVSPDYLYVPREGSQSWTARNKLSANQWRELVQKFEQAEEYTIAYHTDDVLIVRSHNSSEATSPLRRTDPWDTGHSTDTRPDIDK